MYEKYFTQEDKIWVNREVYSIGNTIQIGNDYPQKDGYSIDMNLYRSRSGNAILCGVSTGRWVSYNDENYLQIVGNFGDYGYGYVNASEVNQNAGKIVAASKDSMAQTLLKKLIYNNKTLIENNLLCAGLMQKISQSGKAVPKNLTYTLANLQYRLNARNTRLEKSPYLKGQTKATPPGYNKYSSALNAIMDDPDLPALGIVPVVIYIIGSVVITALLGWIIYLIFKPDYADSEADLVISRDLMKALDTLEPEAKAKVIVDLEGQIDKANVEGKIKGKSEGSASMFKNIGLFAAGVGIFFAVRPAIDRLGISTKK